jgi:peptidase YpeB-like protein
MILLSHSANDIRLIGAVSKLSFKICDRRGMRIFFTLLFLSLLAPTGLARAGDEDHGESDGLAELLEERRDGSILPLFAILRSVQSITGGNVVDIEFEREDGQIKYGIYYLTPEGLRREVYVDAQTGEILEHKAAD